MIKNCSIKVEITYKTNVAELARVLAKVPESAKVSVEKTPHYDQRDPSQTFLKIEWREDV